MAELRRHMERAKHLPFLKLCPACNEHFTDKEAFENNHGYKGERCSAPKKRQRTDVATQTQWWELYNTVMAAQPERSNVSSKFEMRYLALLLILVTSPTANQQNAFCR